MGDRANFGFRDGQDDPVIYLYGHWAGHRMMERLAEAIAAAQPRWSDAPYATRICISQIIGDDWSGETGWGIYPSCVHHGLCDNEHSIPVVDWKSQTVSLYTRGGWGHEPDPETEKPACTWSLPLFCKKFGKDGTKRQFAYAQPAKTIVTPAPKPKTFTADEVAKVVAEAVESAIQALTSDS